MDSSRFTHHGHALRSGRVSEANRAYLLTTVTHQRHTIFQDWRLARLLIAEMRRLHDQQLVQSLAWVVMPDHLHWLIQLQEIPLPKLVLQLKSRSAIAINKARNASGRVWQKGFHDHALRKEEGLTATARYIVANPLRAGLVQRVGDYPHWDAIWL
ncbi:MULTISPECIES: transposase [Pseudomonadaceae]|jgi:REP element-mobilizing transposase RayT|uniref:Transposase n=3 Tax=Gammaproteobacteria TaxID=1236 RepID=A0A2T5PJJ7_ECTOL|nr:MULTISPECIES: transposase [Pseudomonas]AXO60513.1 transposase [Pseudomonas sp. phDV1]MDH1339955.1 transposase [Pseudomonas oleovorans]MDH1868441.1 transposase [Pseudomonas chengduensis]MDH2198420.1 transposase [Pseudomonas oleovorans]PPV39376.1 transposase [Pseudomonas oleovorans]